MKRLISLIILLAVLALALAFSVLNSGDININYHFGTFIAPLSLVLAITLACGAFFGVLASLGIVIKMRHEVSMMKKKIRDTEQEVNNLRAMPIKDTH